MADILPVNTQLPYVNEGVNVNVSFTPSLSSGEVLTNIKITSHDLPSNINVSTSSYNGIFKDNFSLPYMSLKYRDGDELKAVSSFQELPPKGTVDVYSYKGPETVLKDFHITVVMNYTETDPATSTTTSKSITKSYIQPIRGNYGDFAQKLLDYLGV